MDRGTSIRADHAASGGSASGQFEIKMGEKETVHGWGCSDRGRLSNSTRLDGGDCAHVCDRAGDCWSPDLTEFWGFSLLESSGKVMYNRPSCP